MCQESLTIELGSFSVLQTHLDTFHKSDIKVEDHAIEDMDFEIKYEEEDKVNENPVVIPIKNMSKHMKNMNIQLPNPMVKCDICGNDLKRGSLLNHKKSVHGVRNVPKSVDKEPGGLCEELNEGGKYQCEICNKKYTTKGNLATHKKSVHVPKIGKIEEPGHLREFRGDSMGYWRKYSYTEIVHDGITFYQCNYCNKEYEDKGRYRSHMYKCSYVYTCSVCGKTYNHKEAGLNCEAKHTNSYKYSCSWCGKGFVKKQRLETHELIHTGITPYQCNECGKGFKQSNQLKSHMRIHTGETPFQCEKCFKKFKFASMKSKHKCVL